MLKRLIERNLTLLLGLAIAALAAATLSSYVIVGQRFGGSGTPQQGPGRAVVVADGPTAADPLVLPAPVAETPVTKPEPQIGNPVGEIPAITVAAPSEETAEPQDAVTQTLAGSIELEIGSSLTERAFGMLDTVTLNKGLVKPSTKDAKDEGKPQGPAEDSDDEEAKEEDDEVEEAKEEDDDDDDEPSEDEDPDDDPSQDSDASVSGDDSTHSGSIEGQEVGGQSSKGKDKDKGSKGAQGSSDDAKSKDKSKNKDKGSKDAKDKGSKDKDDSNHDSSDSNDSSDSDDD